MGTNPKRRRHGIVLQHWNEVAMIFVVAVASLTVSSAFSLNSLPRFQGYLTGLGTFGGNACMCFIPANASNTVLASFAHRFRALDSSILHD